MRVEESRGWCSKCRSNVLARRLTVIHVPDLRTTMSLVSVWLQLWGLIVNPPFLCTRCGARVLCENNERDNILRALIPCLVILGSIVAIGLFFVYLAR
jgi:hypothetical protein